MKLRLLYERARGVGVGVQGEADALHLTYCMEYTTYISHNRAPPSYLSFFSLFLSSVLCICVSVYLYLSPFKTNGFQASTGEGHSFHMVYSALSFPSFVHNWINDADTEKLQSPSLVFFRYPSCLPSPLLLNPVHRPPLLPFLPPSLSPMDPTSISGGVLALPGKLYNLQPPLYRRPVHPWELAMRTGAQHMVLTS